MLINKIKSDELEVCQLGYVDCLNWFACPNKEYCRFVSKAWPLPYLIEARAELRAIIVAFSSLQVRYRQEMCEAGWAEAVSIPWRKALDLGLVVDKSLPDGGYQKAIDLPYEINQEGFFVRRSIVGVYQRAQQFPYLHTAEGLYVTESYPEEGWIEAEFLPEYLDWIPF